jgi:tetratricopeptide repeat protein
MADCSPLKTEDPLAYRLCQDRLRDGDLTDLLDRGTTRLDFSQAGRPRRVSEEKAGDGRISVPEVYDRYLQVVEAKGLRIDETSPRVPWASDEGLLRATLGHLSSVRSRLLKQGLLPETVSWRMALSTGLFDWIRRPRREGGLGIHFSPATDRPPRDLGEILRLGESNCLEFAFLYTAVGRAAGLETVPLEVFRDASGRAAEHFMVGVRLDPQDPSRLFFLDLADGSAGEKTAKIFAESSRLELLSYYYNALALTAPAREAGRLYERALRFAPSQYMVLNNYAWWLFHVAGRPDAALAVLHKAESINPQYPYIYLGLAEVYEKTGRGADARSARAKADTLFQTP